MAEPWQLSIVDAANQIRRGTLSSTELVDSTLSRLRDTEDYARAWAYVDEEGARDAARAADRDLNSGVDNGPMAGIPIGIKDVIDVAGMPTEAGSESLRGNVARDDAEAVGQMRHNGAIILGKTETYEFAFGQGTPPTRNPWDPDRYAGGSSVGSGVAVAVGSVAGAVGTDTGGSVRNPASINGLVGLKPTTGVISGHGLYNVSRTLDQLGPIARTTADCALMFYSMVQPEAASLVDPGSRGSLNQTGTRIAVDRAQWDEWGVSAGVGCVLDAAIADLQHQGFELVELKVPELAMALPTSLAICLAESVEHHKTRLHASPRGYLHETRVMIETGALIPAADVVLATRVRKFLRSTITAALDSVGVAAILSPTLTAVSPLASQMSNELTGEANNNSLSSALKMLTAASVSGLPGLSVACGFSEGQPVGMHLMGRMYSEPELFAIGTAYERETPWHARVPVATMPALRADEVAAQALSR